MLHDALIIPVYDSKIVCGILWYVIILKGNIVSGKEGILFMWSWN